MAREEDQARGIARRARLAPASALLVAGAFALWRGVAGDPLTDAAERALLDARFAVRGGWDPSGSVAVIALDEDAATAAPDPASRRRALAAAIPALRAAGAQAVAADMLLIGATTADAALAAQIAAPGAPVVLAVAGLDQADGAALSSAPGLDAALARHGFTAAIEPPGAPRPGRILAPDPELLAEALPFHVNLLRDPDRAARRIPAALFPPGGAPIPALPLGLAAAAQGLRPMLGRDEARIGARRIPLDPEGRIVIDHPGPAGAVPRIPLSAAIAGELPDLTGRVVLIGATAQSLRDLYATPYGADVPGVEVLAGATAALMEGRVIRRDRGTAALSAGLAMALCLGALGAARLRRDAAALAVGGLLALAAVGGPLWSFAAHGLWLDGISALGALGLGALGGGWGRHARTRAAAAAAERERENLKGFVAPALAERLARDGAVQLTRRAQEAAALFVDVAGYTTLSEEMTPVEVADFLGELHAVFETTTAAHAGVVVDWQGDGALVVFGLPDPAPDDAARALACGAALAGPCAALARWRPAAPPVLRVSVHAGPAAAAILGGRRQQVVTVTGDTVNVASRLQEVAKSAGADFVASREALDAAGIDPTAAGWRLASSGAVRGRRATTEVWAAPM